ncbi:MAG: RNA polymerase sigma-70 factor [Rhodothermaceae bacterium]|nr:RNA polymerase sigma-70 factor [Rhodothermaceae bacterium]
MTRAGPDMVSGPLAAHVRLNDPAALTQVYRVHQAPLVRYAHRLTGSIETAHDVVQDVFVKLWEQRETLIVELSLQALLYTMTRNRALNQNRRRTRIAPDVEVEDAHHQATHSADPVAPDAVLQARELGRYLRRWIGELPPRRAEAFALSRFDGLSHAEIATVMGLSIRTVDTHIVHALRDLRHRLDALVGAPSRQPLAP